MTQYALPQHVFVALSGDHVVFLDLKQDRYLALDAIKASSLAAVVRGWPRPALAESTTAVADPEAVAQLLVKRGLLSADATTGKDAAPVEISPPVSELTAHGFEGPSPVGPGLFASFLAASMLAALAFRLLPLERIVLRVRRRNEAHRDTRAPLDPERTGQLIAAFGRLRPFLFTSRNACLFESFVLLEFLARHGVHPAWVFGVQAQPFAAHCWLQQDGFVLNDTVEHVTGFTPIMVV